jgi:streptomycin 6-kinase
LDTEFKSEIEALKIFQGDGIEKLLKEDPESCAILIERLHPGKPLSELDDDDQATRILAGVMKKLWKPLPEEHHFSSLSEWTKALYDLKERYPDGNYPHISSQLVSKAISWLEMLIQTSDKPMLIHGDLHHDNVLSSDRGGWLAIDPKGVAAEPCYEVGAMIRNPYKKMDKHPRMQEIMKRRIEILSEELGFDRERIYQWCLVQTVLSAVWSIEDPHGRWEHSLDTATILEKINW